MAGNVSVKLDRAHLEARFRRGKAYAGPILARQVLDDCNQYAVPDDGEHILKSSGRTGTSGEDYTAEWSTVYAAYQFYGAWPDGTHAISKHTQGFSTNPSTQWTESTRAAYGADWNQVAQREFVIGAGG